MADIDKSGSGPDNIAAHAQQDFTQRGFADAPDNPGPGMAGAPHGERAANAATYLERSGSATQSFGTASAEIDRQAGCLIQWARTSNCILGHDYVAGLFKHQSTTAEHQVFFRASDNRAVKCTYPGTFGITPGPKGAQHAATPWFYLRRIELMNRVFNSDFRLEGIMLGESMIIGASGQHASIVVSQPWIRPADPEEPHPSDDEIALFMESLGFAAIGSYHYGWQRTADRVTVLDARPDNFIKSAEGVVPIDLVVGEDRWI
jgi:hypothetical protein